MTVAARDRSPVTDLLGELPDGAWLIVCYTLYEVSRTLAWMEQSKPDHPVHRLQTALEAEIARLKKT